MMRFNSFPYGVKINFLISRVGKQIYVFAFYVLAWTIYNIKEIWTLFSITVRIIWT